VASGSFEAGAHEDSVTWRLDPANATSMRIDAGALMAATSTHGRFGSDAFVEGGEVGTTDAAGGYGQPPRPAPIAGTEDRDLVATFRQGAFRYRVPLDDGTYRVTLTFVEPSSKAGENVFDVLVNGSTALERFDVAAVAGAPLTTVTRTLPAVAKGGVLDLQFLPRQGRAIVSTIEIAR
jgi:beta-galactosidase